MNTTPDNTTSDNITPDNITPDKAKKAQAAQKLTNKISGYFTDVVRFSLNHTAKQSAKMTFKDHGILGVALKQGMLSSAKLFPKLFGNVESNSRERTREKRLHWTQRPEWNSIPQKLDTIISLLRGDRLRTEEAEEENRLFLSRLFGKKPDGSEDKRSDKKKKDDSGMSGLGAIIKSLFSPFTMLFNSVIGKVFKGALAGLGLKSAVNLLKPGRLSRLARVKTARLARGLKGGLTRLKTAGLTRLKTAKAGLAGVAGGLKTAGLTRLKTAANVLKPGAMKAGLAGVAGVAGVAGLKWGLPDWANKAVVNETKTAEKIIGKEVVGEVKSTSKFGKLFSGNKIAEKASSAVVKQVATKGSGALLKTVAKKIPFVGLGVGAALAYDRVKEGEYVAAAFEVLSGAASTIPGLGTAASTLIDAGLLANDVYKEMKKQQKEKSVEEKIKEKTKQELIADGKLEKLQELDKIREEKQKVEQEFQNFVKANKDDPSVGRLLNKYLKDPESLTIGEMERAKSTGIIEQVERGKRLNQLNKLQRTLESSDEVKKETKQVEEAAQKKQDQMAKTLEGAKKIPVTTWVANSAGTGAPGVPIKDEIWVSSTGVPLTPEEVQLKELLEKNQQNSLLPPMTSNQKAEKDQMAIKLENSPKPSTTGPVIIDNSTKNNMVTPGKPSASLLVAPSFTKDFQLSLYQRPSYV